MSYFVPKMATGTSIGSSNSLSYACIWGVDLDEKGVVVIVKEREWRGHTCKQGKRWIVHVDLVQQKEEAHTG